MADGPPRVRAIDALKLAKRAPPDATQPPHQRSNSRSTADNATVFSLALFHEKYAESLAYVSPAEFRVWWVASVALHVGCAVFLVQVGKLYLYLQTRPVMWFFELYAVVVDTSYFPDIAAAYFCGAGVHFAMLGMLLAHSVRQQRLAFRGATAMIPPIPPIPPAGPDVHFAATSRSESDRQQRRWRACAACGRELRRYLRALLNAFWAVREAFDIRSKYYGATWVAMEVAQTLLQTYQAFRLSALMPRLWMTNVVVALIVLNCWALSIVTRCFRSEATHARLYGLALSLVLDLVSFILVPVLVFLPYQSQYDRDVGDFSDVYWYDDVWLVRMVNELQLLFVVSLLDGASKGMMALSVPRSLYVLTKLLRERPAKVSVGSVRLLARMSRRRATIVPDQERSLARQQRRHQSQSSQSGAAAFGFNSARLDVSSVTENTLDASFKAATMPRAGPRFRLQPLAAINSSRVERWGHRFLQVWGVAVLVTHLHATTKAHPSNCALQSYPWFVSKPTCSLLEIDCRANDILYAHGGDADTIDAILRGVDLALVQHVVIRHCPRLAFPPSLSQLPRLVGLKIRDSTIMSWNESAALTQARHPELRFLFLGDVNASAMPEGMVARDFPARLRDIELCRVNLTALPDHLDEIWPSDMFLLLEQLQLSTFPAVVLRLRANLLSLAFNNFTAVPRALLAMPHTETLILNGNPLAALPSSSDAVTPSGGESAVVDIDELYPSEVMLELHLVMTDVESLPPDWSDADGFLARGLVNAPHTPLCSRLLAAAGPEVAAKVYAGATAGTGIDCFDDERLTWYPINNP